MTRTTSMPRSAYDADATHRQRFGLILALGLGLIATGISYVGTRDAWVTAGRRPVEGVVATSRDGGRPGLGHRNAGGAAS